MSYLNLSCSIETDVHHKQNRAFTVSSNDRKAWATQGAELFVEFMTDKGKYNDL
jgi:hypothetical protein